MAQNKLETLRVLVREMDREELKEAFETVKEQFRETQRKEAALESTKYQRGDRVTFVDRKGVPIRGTVERVNKVTVSVLTDKGTSWRVGYGILRKE